MIKVATLGGTSDFRFFLGPSCAVVESAVTAVCSEGGVAAN